MHGNMWIELNDASSSGATAGCSYWWVVPHDHLHDLEGGLRRLSMVLSTQGLTSMPLQSDIAQAGHETKRSRPLLAKLNTYPGFLAKKRVPAKL